MARKGLCMARSSTRAKRRTWNRKPRTCFLPTGICKKMNRKQKKSKNRGSLRYGSPCPTQLRDCVERITGRGTVSFCAVRPYYICKKTKRKLQTHEKNRQRPPLAKEPLPYAQPIWPGRKEISGRLPRIANLPISICKKMHWKPKKDKRPAFGASPCAARNLAAAKLAAKIRINRGKDFFVIQPLYICKKTKRNLPVWQKKQQRHTRPDKRLCCAWQEAKEVLRNDKPPAANE